MRVLIAAGGTAGHINPALAIAGALKAADPQAEIHFAGRREGMEYGLVTKAGYPFHHIEINGFQRHLSAENIARNVVAVWVPDDRTEAARDLSRALADARDDLRRAKQRMSKFLLRHGHAFDEMIPLM